MTAAGLSGAASAVEPKPEETRKRRHLPVVLAAVAGAVAAIRLARRGAGHEAVEPAAARHGAGSNETGTGSPVTAGSTSGTVTPSTRTMRDGVPSAPGSRANR